MSEYVIQGETLTGIADAIRAKSNKAGLIPTTSMAGEIMAIETGSTPDPVEQATPSITVSSSGLITASATQDEGYVSAGTKSATKQLTVQAAQTITPGTSDKTIQSGRYLTGTQTIKGDPNLIAENIKSGVSIFGIVGAAAGLSAGLSAVTVCSFTPTAYQTNFTAQHNLGVKPNFYVLYGEDVLGSANSICARFELDDSVVGGDGANSFICWARTDNDGKPGYTTFYEAGDLQEATTSTLTIVPSGHVWKTYSKYYVLVGRLD